MGCVHGCVAAHSIYIVHRNVTPSQRTMVFDGFRQSFDELLRRATRPEERRVVASRMKDTLVQARVGLGRTARRAGEDARSGSIVEEKELETVRRRKQLAEGIGDSETVDIAGKVRGDASAARGRRAPEGGGAGGRARAGRAGCGDDDGRAEGRDVGRGSSRGAAAPAVRPETEPGRRPSPAALHDEIDSLGRARAERGPRSGCGAAAGRAEAANGEIVIRNATNGRRRGAAGAPPAGPRARRTRRRCRVPGSASTASIVRSSAPTAAALRRDCRCWRASSSAIHTSRRTPRSFGASCCCSEGDAATSFGAPSRSAFCARSRSSPRRRCAAVPDSAGGVSSTFGRRTKSRSCSDVAGGQGNPARALRPRGRLEHRRRGHLRWPATGATAARFATDSAARFVDNQLLGRPYMLTAEGASELRSARTGWPRRCIRSTRTFSASRGARAPAAATTTSSS